MQTLLVFISVAALSVLASNQRLLEAGRFFNLAQLAASGMIFLLLGAALGPGGGDLLHSADLTAARPLLALGLGLGGMLMGLNMDPSLLRALPRAVWVAAATHSGLAFLMVAIPIAGVLILMLGVDVPVAIGAAALLGGAASISSSNFAVLWHRAGRLDRLTGLSITLLTLLDDLMGVLVLALALVFGAESGLGAGVGLVALAVLLGVLCGALTAYLIHESGDGAEMTAILLGSVGLVSGAAAFLSVSSLIAGLSCGVTLAFIGGKKIETARRALARPERPVYLVLLFLVGAHVQLTNWVGWLLVPTYIALRFAGKIYGGRLATKAAGSTLHLPPELGFALLGQGSVSLCLLIEYLILVPGTSSQLVFDVGVAAAVVNEVLATRTFRLSLGAEAKTQPDLPADYELNLPVDRSGT
ncbi:MAG: cation:proton antiporter [Myxococcaceae bacterium]